MLLPRSRHEYAHSCVLDRGCHVEAIDNGHDLVLTDAVASILLSQAMGLVLD